MVCSPLCTHYQWRLGNCDQFHTFFNKIQSILSEILQLECQRVPLTKCKFIITRAKQNSRFTIGYVVSNIKWNSSFYLPILIASLKFFMIWTTIYLQNTYSISENKAYLKFLYKIHHTWGCGGCKHLCCSSSFHERWKNTHDHATSYQVSSNNMQIFEFQSFQSFQKQWNLQDRAAASSGQIMVT